jgi:hypothetical protein
MKTILITLLTFILISPAAFSQSIKLEDVPKHIGDSVTVCGKIFSTNYLETGHDSPTFLNMGAAYPNDILSVLIWKKARAKFSYKPEEKLLNKTICVTGRIVSYKGKPQIVVHQESQITLNE